MNTKEAEKFIMNRKRVSGHTPTRHQCYIAGYDIGFDAARLKYNNERNTQDKMINDRDDRITKLKLFIAKLSNLYKLDESLISEIKQL